MIGFEEASYVIGEEQQNISVCVNLTGQTEIPLLLNISTHGNAKCKCGKVMFNEVYPTNISRGV